MFTGKRTPRLILEDLLKLDVRTVLLETGSKLLKDFLDHDLVDEMVLYVAPTIIGQGKALVEEILQANSNREYKISSVGLVGKDLRIKVSLR